MEIEKFESILLSYDRKIKPRIEYFYDWYEETISSFGLLNNEINFKLKFELIDSVNEVTDEIKKAVKNSIDDFLEFEPPEIKYLILKVLINHSENQKWFSNEVFNRLITEKYQKLKTYIEYKYPIKEPGKANDFLHIKHLKGKKEFSLNDIGLITKDFSGKRKILIIHLMNKNGYFDLIGLHQNITERAKIIGRETGYDWNNVYKYFNDLTISPDHREYFNYKNLIAILPLFEYIQLSDIESIIKAKIKEVKPTL